MFYYIYIGEEFLNFNLIEKGYYNNQINNKWDCVFDWELVMKNNKSSQ